MPLNRRTLTISFERSVSSGVPSTMEVAVVPLAEPGSPESDVTLVGGTQIQTVLLNNQTNVVRFSLVPTDHPNLTQRVLYRIGWREKFLGRQYTHDFVMPDSDVNFRDLGDIGNILGGTTYVQWTDRGTPGGVAALNELGQVVDADGNPLIATEGGASIQSMTASGGILKVVDTDPLTGVTTYDFQLDPSSAARKWHGPVIPASGNFGAIAHHLGNPHPLVVVRDATTRLAPANIVCRPNLDGDTISVEFPAPIITGQYVATVIG